jgi:hypothetical protein
VQPSPQPRLALFGTQAEMGLQQAGGEVAGGDDKALRLQAVQPLLLRPAQRTGAHPHAGVSLAANGLPLQRLRQGGGLQPAGTVGGAPCQAIAPGVGLEAAVLHHDIPRAPGCDIRRQAAAVQRDHGRTVSRDALVPRGHCA